jgi:hypothetical protein
LAGKAAQRLFPVEEASLIVYEVARDAPFYDPTITEEMIGYISRFAREIGALEGGDQARRAGRDPVCRFLQR